MIEVFNDLFDNGSDWKTTPPRFRKLLMFISWISVLVLLFVIVFTGYHVSASFAACYTSIVTVVGTMMGLYTYQRGRMDMMITGEDIMAKLDSLLKDKIPDGMYQKVKKLIDQEPPADDSPPSEDDPK